jgi:hypothetical protein
MRDARAWAYSLSRDNDVWRWCVYDEDGDVVAGGTHLSQDAAQAAVDTTLRLAGDGADMAA